MSRSSETPPAETSPYETLESAPARTAFFQAVRILRRMRPDRQMIGGDADPRREFVRFSGSRSFVFPAGDVDAFEAGEDGAPDRLTVSFMGVASPNSFGSLPTAYVQEVREQASSGRPALGDFIDLFDHRLISLFFRAWARSRPEVLHELRADNPFVSALRAIIGIEGEPLWSRLPDGGASLLARAGLLARRPAPALAIESLVESLFGSPARVVQFVPRWYAIEDRDRTRLGVQRTTLGGDANIGAEVCLSQFHFRVEIGPMGLETYMRLLPMGEAHEQLTSSVRLACGPESDFEFTLVLRAEEVPRLRLGGRLAGDDANPCRLGWSTWINNEGFDNDAADTVFLPLAREGGGGAVEASH